MGTLLEDSRQSEVVEWSLSWELGCLIPGLALSPTCCVTLGKSLHLSESQFSSFKVWILLFIVHGTVLRNKRTNKDFVGLRHSLGPKIYHYFN